MGPAALRARWAYREWNAEDERRREFYGKFVDARDLCFDIGANVGNRVKALERIGCRVVAVEPQRGCARHLRATFGRTGRVTVIEAAAGPAEGRGTLRTTNDPALASMSPEWIKCVQHSGRFGDRAWDDESSVEVVTLDGLIARFGTPRFVKIDVEGYEYEVLRGLTQPLPLLSFEWTPEHAVSEACLSHLGRLGPTEFNYSFGESMRLASRSWVSGARMAEVMAVLKDETWLFGDVYARSVRGPGRS